MRNQYGQTDLLGQYLRAQPKQHHTGLGTALRLGGAALSAYGDKRARDQRQASLADALRALNGPVMDESGALGPTVAAAAKAPIADPAAMAALLSDPATAGIGQSLVAKALAGPEKPEAYTLKPGEARFRGGEQIASVPAVQKPQAVPQSVLEYQFAQQNGYGGSYPDFLKAKRAPGVVVNTGDIGAPIAPGGGAAPTVPAPETNPYAGLPPGVQEDVAKDAYKRAVQSFEKDEEALSALRQTMALFDQFESLMDRQQTGGFLRRLPGAGTIEGSFDPEIQEMQAIADRVTPLMRQGMPGAASDRDVRMFRGAAPGPDKLPEVNRALIQAHRIQVQNATDRLAFRQEYLAQNKTLSGADEQWNNYLNANSIFANSDPDNPRLNTRRQTWREYFGSDGDRPVSISEMNMQQLMQLDADNLTPEELVEAAERWDALNVNALRRSGAYQRRPAEESRNLGRAAAVGQGVGFESMDGAIGLTQPGGAMQHILNKTGQAWGSIKNSLLALTGHPQQAATARAVVALEQMGMKPDQIAQRLDELGPESVDNLTPEELVEAAERWGALNGG